MSPSVPHGRVEWREWLGPTGAPVKWGFVLTAVAGLLAGAGVGLVIPPERGVILSGLTATLVAATGASGPPPIALGLARLAAVAGLVSTMLAFSTHGHPVWAAAAMACMSIVASAAIGAGPIGAAIGKFVLLAYVLAAALSTMAALRPEVSLSAGLIHIIIGCLAGVIVTWVNVLVRRARQPAGSPRVAPLPPLWHPMLRSLRTVDVHAREGIRRAVPLALGVFLFERSASRDALWIFMAAFVVLLPGGKPPVAITLTRVSTTVLAVFALGVLTIFVPHEVLFALAIAVLLAGMACSDRYPLPSSMATTAGAILLAASPTGAIGTWAAHRLLDTMIGCALAVGATYLLWPGDRIDPAPVER